MLGLYGMDSFINRMDMSKYDKFETIQERIDRLQDYYDDPNNGLNKCFIVQKIKELKQRQLQEELEKRNFFRIFTR